MQGRINSILVGHTIHLKADFHCWKAGIVLSGVDEEPIVVDPSRTQQFESQNMVF